MDKPSYGCVTKKDDKETVCASIDGDINDKKSPKVKYVTNEMIESDYSSSSYKDDYMVILISKK